MKLYERIGTIAEGPTFQRIITVLIVANAITLGLEAAPNALTKFDPLFHLLNRLVVAVFVLEIVAKIVYRRRDFFRNGWNIFDFIIVGISVAPSARWQSRGEVP